MQTLSIKDRLIEISIVHPQTVTLSEHCDQTQFCIFPEPRLKYEDHPYSTRTQALSNKARFDINRLDTPMTTLQISTDEPISDALSCVCGTAPGEACMVFKLSSYT